MMRHRTPRPHLATPAAKSTPKKNLRRFQVRNWTLIHIFLVPILAMALGMLWECCPKVQYFRTSSQVERHVYNAQPFSGVLLSCTLCQKLTKHTNLDPFFMLGGVHFGQLRRESEAKVILGGRCLGAVSCAKRMGDRCQTL